MATVQKLVEEVAELIPLIAAAITVLTKDDVPQDKIDQAVADLNMTQETLTKIVTDAGGTVPPTE